DEDYVVVLDEVGRVVARIVKVEMFAARIERQNAAREHELVGAGEIPGKNSINRRVHIGAIGSGPQLIEIAEGQILVERECLMADCLGQPDSGVKKNYVCGGGCTEDAVP